MTPVLGSGSSTVMVPRHTELAIKLRGGSSQACPLIHDFPLSLLPHSDTSPFLAVVSKHLMERFALLIFIP